jgi:hypothetical protein
MMDTMSKNANEIDFFITYTRRSAGLGIGCATCHEVLEDLVPTPLWIFTDVSGSRPVCLKCASNLCPLLLTVLRTWYPRINAPGTVPGSARGKPPELMRMGDYRAVECSVLSEYATEGSVQTVGVVEATAEEIARAKESPDLDDDDEDDDDF